MQKLFKILFSTIGIFIIVIFVGAYATLKCEIQDPTANIKTYQDALWWALNASSIGDSNVFPVTVSGRIVGVFLIVIGYCLFTINVGAISAGLTHLTRDKSKDHLLKQIEDYFIKKK